MLKNESNAKATLRPVSISWNRSSHADHANLPCAKAMLSALTPRAALATARGLLELVKVVIIHTKSGGVYRKRVLGEVVAISCMCFPI